MRTNTWIKLGWLTLARLTFVRLGLVPCALLRCCSAQMSPSLKLLLDANLNPPRGDVRLEVRLTEHGEK